MISEEANISTSRNYYMDVLRIIACLMVISLHILGDGLYEGFDTHKAIMIALVCICRCSVPVFLMLSGAFCVNTDIKKSIKKAVFFFFLFVLFKVIYDIWDCYYLDRSISLSQLYYSRGITDLTRYKWHLWYLPEYIILTLISPIINSAAKDNCKVVNYLTILFIIYSIIPKTLISINLFGKAEIQPINALLEPIPINIPLGIGYYCLGKAIYLYFQDKKEKKGHIKSISLFGISSWIIINILTIVFTLKKSYEKGSFDFSMTHWTAYPVFLSAVTLFIFFTTLSLKNNPNHKMSINTVNHIVPYILYIYLIHYIFVDLLTTTIGFTALSFNPLLSVPLKLIIVFIPSYVFAVAAKKFEKLIMRH